MVTWLKFCAIIAIKNNMAASCRYIYGHKVIQEIDIEPDENYTPA
jgi:hypothetical protein